MRMQSLQDFRETEKLAASWDTQWQQSAQSDKFTPLGKRMFVAKRAAIKNILRNLPIVTAVEVGCGSGHTLAVLQEMGYDCVGIDASPHAVSICERKGLRAMHRKLEDVEGAFDLVSSDGMLEHFLNFEPYARHMMRISNRYVLLIQPNHASLIGKTLAFLSEVLCGGKNMYEYNYRMEDFIDVFNRAGFKAVANAPVFHDVFRCLLFTRDTPSP